MALRSLASSVDSAALADVVSRTARVQHAPALGIYFPEAEGAAGDGATDDTVAIQAAINLIQTAGAGRLQLAPTTYVVTTLDVQGGLTIDGYGATFLRPANTPNWTRTITNANRKHVGPADSTRPIIIRGLKVDGNLANQGAYSGYELEQASLLFFSGDNTAAGRERVILEDVWTFGSVSDGVHAVSNVHLTIRNHRALDCFRGGLTFTGGNSKIEVYGYYGGGSVVGAHMDQEVDTPGYGSSYRCDITIQDAIFDTANKPVQVAARAGALIDISKSVIRCGLYVSGASTNGSAGAGKVRFRDCDITTFHATDKNVINNPADVEFNRCTIRGDNPTGVSGTRKTFDVVMNLASTWATGGCNLRFVDCDFEVATTVAGDLFIAIYNNADTFALNNWITIQGGRFSVAYGRAIYYLSGGHLRLDGRTRFAAVTAMRMTHTAGSGRQYEVVVGSIELESTCTTYFHADNGDATCIVRHQGTVIDEAQNNLGAVGTGITANTYQGSRTILVTAAPTTATDGLLGDVARLKTPVAGSPYQWVCTASNHSSTTWKALTTVAA